MPLETPVKTCLSEKLSLRQRQRQARDGAILQTAFDLIVEDGYDALTMEGLAEQLGISRQTLYHYFPSKETLVLRAVLTLIEKKIASTRQIIATNPPSLRLERVIHWMIENRFNPESAAFIRARLMLGPIRAHPEYQSAVEERNALLRQIVEDAQDAGEINPTLPSRLIVQMMLGIVSEAFYEELIADGTVTPAQITQAVAETFLAGLRPKQ